MLETQQNNSNDLDFNVDDYRSFFYTNDKQIKKMDDSFVISLITEKYPDFIQSNKESALKQAFMLFLSDSNHVKYILDYCDITIHDLFKIVYRSYPFLFNTCFTNKVHHVIIHRCYARRTRTKM